MAQPLLHAYVGVCLYHYAVGAPRGKIKLQTEEVTDSKFSIAMKLSARKLDKKDFFGKVSKHFMYMHYCSFILWSWSVRCV